MAGYEDYRARIKFGLDRLGRNTTGDQYELEILRAEVEHLRQGLWDCFREAGGDTDGEGTPVSVVSDLVPLAVECVHDMRENYDSILHLVPLSKLK